MGRRPRVVVPGCVYHVTQRGNNQQDVFFTDEDRRAYLYILKEESNTYNLSILGYCLMTNHVHLIVRPGNELALLKGIGRTHYRHARNINNLHGRTGHLWQGRYYSCIMDNPHRITATAYVERNPLRAGMVPKAVDWPWSSASARLGQPDPFGILDLSDWPRVFQGDWRMWLERPENREFTTAFRAATSRGRPLASDSFVSKLESQIGLRLRPLPVGGQKRRTKSVGLHP